MHFSSLTRMPVEQIASITRCNLSLALLCAALSSPPVFRLRKLPAFLQELFALHPQQLHLAARQPGKAK